MLWRITSSEIEDFKYLNFIECYIVAIKCRYIKE